MAVGGWIPQEHVRYFVKTLAMFAGGDFGDDDWTGLDYALFKEDLADGERVITWPLGDVDVRFSYEPGDGVVVVSLDANHDLETRADTLIFVLQDADTIRDRHEPHAR